MAPTETFTTPDLLADWLMLPPERLEYLADIHDRHEEHGDTPVNHSHYHLKPSKAGGLRVTDAPKQQLKAAQCQILGGLLNRVPLHDAAFGFAQSRNCLQGANRHVGEELVLCFDLADFFPSIHRPRIRGLFRRLAGLAHSLGGHCSRYVDDLSFSGDRPIAAALLRAVP